ncbi:hypothetical protein Pint_22586 [Pistacia integerrima]|uniref:Uncharacterized protein n=1 Tax=Pistacia integerrima TaxID=434235 RepID=A0ACC0YLK1_9ROSI|nr:hypothetical protein Pint_22586 [Pistacia integerrima]
MPRKEREALWRRYAEDMLHKQKSTLKQDEDMYKDATSRSSGRSTSGVLNWECEDHYLNLIASRYTSLNHCFRRVATISANGEHEIGELIARVIEKVGKEGVITVAELENPYILIHDKKISDMNSLVRILELALNKNRELLVVVEDVESDALAMLILNKHHTGVKVYAIKAHGFGENRRTNLDDLAILTGGEVIFEDHGLTLDKVKSRNAWHCKKRLIEVSLLDQLSKVEEACFGAVHCQLMDVVHPGMVPCTKSTLMPRTIKLWHLENLIVASIGLRYCSLVNVWDAWNASTTTKSIDYHIVPQAGVPWVGKSKVDSTQIPRLDPSSSVIMYETRHGNQANPPPPATSDFIAMDTGNCSPHYMRCTINQVLIKYLIYTGMQLALLVQPLALRCPSEPVQVYNKVISNRNYVAKDINFGVRVRAAMLQGVSEVAEAVKVTMGPKSHNEIIEKRRGDPKVTKDGVTMAKSIKFKDKAKNVGADLVKQVASATKTAAGDATTCATVLTQAILTEGCKSVAAGVNVMDLCSGINMAVDVVISDLKGKAQMISTLEEITQIVEFL